MTEVPIHSADTLGRIGGIIASFNPKRKRRYDQLIREGMKPSTAAEKVFDERNRDIQANIS